jgi:hypothetical protein
MHGMRNAHKIFVEKSDGKRPLGRPRCRCVNNIKMNLRETGLEGADWIHLAQYRDQWQDLINTVMKLQFT